MEDDLRTGTPYRISCLRQQPSVVDRRCQIWPIRGHTRFWYTGTASFEKISQAFPRPLPQSPLVFSRSFARAPLSERLGQAKDKVFYWTNATRQSLSTKLSYQTINETPTISDSNPIPLTYLPFA